MIGGAHWSRLLLAVGLAGAATVLLVSFGPEDVHRLETAIASTGWLAPLVFVVVYSFGTAMFVPGLLLTFAGGALFGPVLGSLLNLTGAVLGGAMSFLIARNLAGDWVRRRSGSRLVRLQSAIADEGWRFVAFVRLVPLFPFNLLNYALGLTPVSLFTSVWASAVFMLPGTVAFTYLGHAGLQAFSGDDAWIGNLLFALALLAATTFLPRLARHLLRKPGAGRDS